MSGENLSREFYFKIVDTTMLVDNLTVAKVRVKYIVFVKLMWNDSVNPSKIYIPNV